MKVKQLIEQLKTLDGDLPVCVVNAFYWEYLQAEVVEIVKRPEPICESTLSLKFAPKAVLISYKEAEEHDE